jgi:Flp pilus assembly protein TadG
MERGNSTATQNTARRLRALCRRVRCDSGGAVLVEAAIALPILIMLLLGIVTYGLWFMAAHSLQQAGNDAARSALAGIDADERQELVDQSVEHSVVNAGTLNANLVTVTTSQDQAYFAVSLTYDAAQSGVFSRSLVPLPAKTIQRTAVVQLNSP